MLIPSLLRHLFTPVQLDGTPRSIGHQFRVPRYANLDSDETELGKFTRERDSRIRAFGGVDDRGNFHSTRRVHQRCGNYQQRPATSFFSSSSPSSDRHC